MLKLVTWSLPVALIAGMGLFNACKSVGGANGRLSNSDTDRFADSKVFMDVNDVSIIFPALDVHHKSFDKLIHVSKGLSHGPLLSKDLFGQVLKLAPTDIHTIKPTVEAYENWVVVSLRVDSCAKLTAQSPCKAQLRLITSPMEIRKESIADHAIHLVYDIPESQKLAFFQSFVDLKKSTSVVTDSVPLGIHPALEKEGMDGPFAKALSGIVDSYAQTSNLKAIAAMITVAASNWRFAGGRVQDGKLTQEPIPCQTQKTVDLFGTTGFAGNFSNDIKPLSNCADRHINRIVKTNGFEPGTPPFQREQGFSHLSEEEKDADVRIALASSNPTISFLGNTDCVTCHVAGKALARVKGFDFLTAQDGLAERFVAPLGFAERPGDTEMGKGAYSVKAMGLDQSGDKLSISLYALNDTMRVAHELNLLIKAEKLK